MGSYDDLRAAAERTAIDAEELARDLARKIAKGQSHDLISAARKRLEAAAEAATSAAAALQAATPQQHPSNQQGHGAVGAFNAAINIEESQ